MAQRGIQKFDMDKEFLQKELERTSSWIQFADKKSGFLAVYYSVFIGYIITIKSVIIEQLTNSVCVSVFDILIIALLCSITFGVYHIFFSVFPNLENSNSKNSLFYYGHIAKLSSSKYNELLYSATEEGVKKHLSEQIHTNSQIANKKMCHVKKAAQALFATAGLLLLLVLFL